MDDDPKMLRFVRAELSAAGYTPLLTGGPEDRLSSSLAKILSEIRGATTLGRSGLAGALEALDAAVAAAYG